MGGKSHESYEVGYKKPPKATQFQKGQSGNRSGRPRKAPLPSDAPLLLETIDNEEIRVRIDGKWKRMRAAEAQFRQLFAKGITGDLATARLLAKMAFDYSAAEDRGNYGYEIISETEAARRFGPNWRTRVEEHNARLGLGS